MHPDFTTASDCPTCAELRDTIVLLHKQIAELNARRPGKRKPKKPAVLQRQSGGQFVFCACGCGHLAVAYNNNPPPYLFGHHKHPPKELPYTVTNDGCWMWQRGLTGSGYGQITRGSATFQAHRAYYEQKYGTLLLGQVADHLCRHRACVNPDHVEPVSVATNTRRGKVTKLTVATIIEIRALARDGASPVAIAKQFGVSDTNIRAILTGKTWRGVDLGATGD